MSHSMTSSWSDPSFTGAPILRVAIVGRVSSSKGTSKGTCGSLSFYMQHIEIIARKV